MMIADYISTRREHTSYWTRMILLARCVYMNFFIGLVSTTAYINTHSDYEFYLVNTLESNHFTNNTLWEPVYYYDTEDKSPITK